MPALLDVGIYSELTPTCREGRFYACLTEVSASTFQQARDAVIDRCRQWKHLHWTLMFIQPQIGDRKR